jgi:hypothetical protein
MCDCAAIGLGVQLFRIRDPGSRFEALADLGALPAATIGGRWVWRCRGCGALYALLRLPFKDEEDILVRSRSSADDWGSWDWQHLAELAEQSRWQGPRFEKAYVL